MSKRIEKNNRRAPKSNRNANVKETTVKKDAKKPARKDAKNAAPKKDDKKKPSRKPKVQNHPVRDAVKAAAKKLPRKHFAKATVQAIRDLYLAAKKAEGTKKYHKLREQASAKREKLGLTLSQFIAVEHKVLGLGK